MAESDKDLCQTCEHYWVDIPLPVSHCGILDTKGGLKLMDDVVPCPCLECPFNCYKKK